MANQSINIQLPEFFEWQKEVYSIYKRKDIKRIVIAASRQIGKTHVAVPICMDSAMQGGKVWWIAPEYSLTEVAWETLDELTSQINEGYGKRLIQAHKQTRKFIFPGRGYIQVKSADDPSKLRSKSLDLALFDEAAYMSRDAWDSVSPALSTTGGKAIFISSAFGKNWFWELWRLGQDEDYPSWWSSSYDYTHNPLISMEFIENERRTKPGRVFSREYMAEFIDAGGEVFTNVRNCATIPASPVYSPETGHKYVMGVDWGSRQDFTVITVMDADKKEMSAVYRISGADFDAQYNQIANISTTWRVRMCISESNNIGLTNSHQLRKLGVPVVEFNTNQYTKRPLIESWAVALERGEVKIINEPQLIKEHESYESDVAPGGTIRYYAPHKGHDDYVISAALCWHGVQECHKVPARAVFMPHSGLYSSRGRDTARRNYNTTEYFKG